MKKIKIALIASLSVIAVSAQACPNGLSFEGRWTTNLGTFNLTQDKNNSASYSGTLINEMGSKNVNILVDISTSECRASVIDTDAKTSISRLNVKNISSGYGIFANSVDAQDNESGSLNFEKYRQD
jgi:hypothetical protein